jgi:hypothetical protein
MQEDEPTLADWKAALESDLATLADLRRIAAEKGNDPNRQSLIIAAKRRIKEANREIQRLSAVIGG